jgi:hypothetical protein
MEVYVSSAGELRRRRRRRRRGLPASYDRRRDLWAQTLAGAAIASGLGVAVAAPVDEAASRGRLSVLQQYFDANPAQGLRVGSLLVTPTLAAGGALDSNVFAAPKGERADVFAALVPALDIESDWPIHAFGLRAQGEFRRYATFNRENIGNVSVAGTGRIDLGPNAYLLTGGGYQLLHEDRGALVPVQGVQPTQFTVTSGKAGIVIETAPMGLRLDATVDSYGYNNVSLFGGAVVGETARDHIVYALQPRISYQILPEYDAFLRAAVNRRQYNSTREPDGLERSSTGIGASIGSAFELPRFAAGELYLGFLGQNYDSKAAKQVVAVDFGGNLEWRPQEATSLRFNLTRSVEESAILGSAGYLQTALRLGIEHAVMPRVAVSGSIGYINADFTGPVVSSNLYQAKFGARYAVAGNLSAALEYDVGHRASGAALPNYTRHIIELRLRGTL